jgi:23S rRNA pseudouridine1911/1915/1917 synthase
VLEKMMEILFSDRDLAVCVKPVGLDSEHEVPAGLKEALGGEIFPIHRLDKNVGGVMVFARHKAAAAQLSRLVQDGSLVKEYVAIVHGSPEIRGEMTDFLFKDSAKNKVFVVKTERKGAKLARLEYESCTQMEGRTLVRIRLHTGRSHQIRVQFASRGFPLVGDHKYGARDGEKAPKLFSCCLTFPWKGKSQKFEYLPEWGKL